MGGVTSWRHHILGGEGEAAIYTRKSSGSNEVHYLSKDHLGSTDVITDAAGAVEVRTSFSAFGQRRNAAGWSGNPTPADWTGITGTTRHGYTGHEMLDNLNLTHMNGRVYDQITGRFLSPDPFVQAPFNGQSLNRYSYVFNNPLSNTDPSGFFTFFHRSADGGISSSGPRFSIQVFLELPVLLGGAPSRRREANSPPPNTNTVNRVASQMAPNATTAGVCNTERCSTVGGASLGRTLLSVGVGFAPVVGALQSIDELATGRDRITGEETSRLLAGVGVVAGLFGLKGAIKAFSKADDIAEGVVEIAGARRAGNSLFNPSGSSRNCVNGVCAFLNTIQTKTLQTASPNVADNLGRIPTALGQITEQTGAFFGKGQLNALNTARDRQFFVVFTGADFLRSSHVAVGIVNKGNKTIFDPQTGQTFKNLSDFSTDFVAFPLIFK